MTFGIAFLLIIYLNWVISLRIFPCIIWLNDKEKMPDANSMMTLTMANMVSASYVAYEMCVFIDNKWHFIIYRRVGACVNTTQEQVLRIENLKSLKYLENQFSTMDSARAQPHQQAYKESFYMDAATVTIVWGAKKWINTFFSQLKFCAVYCVLCVYCFYMYANKNT